MDPLLSVITMGTFSNESYKTPESDTVWGVLSEVTSSTEKSKKLKQLAAQS